MTVDKLWTKKGFKDEASTSFLSNINFLLRWNYSRSWSAGFADHVALFWRQFIYLGRHSVDYTHWPVIGILFRRYYGTLCQYRISGVLFSVVSGHNTGGYFFVAFYLPGFISLSRLYRSCCRQFYWLYSFAGFTIDIVVIDESIADYAGSIPASVTGQRRQGCG